MVADSPFTVFTKYEAIKQTHREHYTNSLQLHLMTIKSLFWGRCQSEIKLKGGEGVCINYHMDTFV